MLRNLLNDETGFLVSAELVLIFTLVFCGVAVGVSMVRDSLVSELGDVSEAIGALNQSYNFTSLTADGSSGYPNHAVCSGSGFADEADSCDCLGVTFGVTTSKADPSTLNVAEGT
ncbi:MAG: hypothetical protein HQ518_26895 [Rhodopirellula sp.]|nr:hypothetical protein [Rhodopirellula sp.]